jgi:sec-independent protein translocase protein TatC
MFEDLRPHLIELRKRLFLSVVSVVLTFIVAFFFHQSILDWITKPLNQALEKVGVEIESKNQTEWKLQQEANQTVTATTKVKTTTPEVNVTFAQTLHHMATTVEDNQTATLLTDASHYIETLDTKVAQLEEDVTYLKNRNAQKSFEGMVTTHQISGVFFVALKVSFFAALLGALPFILYQIWLFIAPGLYNHEKKMIAPFVIGGSAMFFVGVLFAYYIVTPFGFQFLITFGSFLYTPLINIEDYVGFFTKIMIGFGLAFELPIVSYFLALLGLITDQSLKEFFKYAVVLIFVTAALLTPPDILTQMLMAFPMMLLYGVSIIIVKFVNPHKTEE